MAEIKRVSIDSENPITHEPESEVLQIASQKNIVTDSYVQVYVDATNGNDENDGARNSPFKHLEKALELLNDNFYSEYRIYLKSGEYHFPKNVMSISGVSIHLVTNEPNTSIYIESTQHLAWYNCHLRISPDVSHLSTLDAQSYEELTSSILRNYQDFCKVYVENGMYFDNCYTLLNYVQLFTKHWLIGVYGSYFEAQRCFIYSPISVRAGTLKLDGSHMSYNTAYLHYHNSFINAQNSNVQIKPHKVNKLYEVGDSNDYRTIFNGGNEYIGESLYAINCSFNSQISSYYQVHFADVNSDNEEYVRIVCGTAFGRYRGFGAPVTDVTDTSKILISHGLSSISGD